VEFLQNDVAFGSLLPIREHRLTNQDLAVRPGGRHGLPLNEKTCLPQRATKALCPYADGGGERKIKKQLDIRFTVIVNYNSKRTEVHWVLDASE
jgi:hypothetical protein